jgi:CDP-glycerol glycerophosphotransferase
MTIKGLSKLLSNPYIFFKDYIKKNKKIKKNIRNYTESMIQFDTRFSIYYYFIYKRLIKEKLFFLAEKSLLKAIDRSEKAIYYYHFANLLKRKNQWWLIVDSYKKAIEKESSFHLKWYIEYADALEKMGRFEAIFTLLKPLSDKKQLESSSYFIYGYALKKLDKNRLSKDAFEEAIKNDNKLNANQFGIGVFYEKKGLWREAEESYTKRAIVEPFNAELFYKLGHVLEKSYYWKEAENAYLKAISLEPKNIDWYYKLGFVQERLKHYKDAVDSYRYASEHREIKTPYWYYRLGYVLSKLEKYQEACDAFVQMKDNPIKIDNQKIFQKSFEIKELIKEESTNIKLWYQLAEQYLLEKNQEEAINTYKELIFREENYNGNTFYLLAYLLTLNNRCLEASKLFIESRVLQKPYGVSERAYKKDNNLKKVINYTEYYQGYTIDENIILYESYHGTSISCNPYALFKEIYKDKHFKGYRHVWVINNKEDIPPDLKSDINLIFIKRDSDGYRRFLAKAKYLINNTTFPDYFICKEEQVYLNTWHGTPLKTLGRDVEEDFMAHKNQTRNFLQASYIISPNSYTTSTLLSSYDIKESFRGVMVTTGYPRQDLMLNINSLKREKICSLLNLSKDKKVVLYAPTWRGEVGESIFNKKELLSNISRLKTLVGVDVLFRGHYMIENLLREAKLDITVVPTNIDTNTLLSVVDILITDYSSIAFDFMALERPIIYYVYDRDAYERERGLYFDLELLGGAICLNIEELLLSVDKSLKESSISILQKEAQKRFCNYDDGFASKRVIDLLFFNRTSNINIYKNSIKPSILIYGGAFLTNGITTSFINLVNVIDKEKYSVTIVINPNSIASNPLKMEQFKKVNRDIKIIPRVGRMLMTLEERWILSEFNREKFFYNREKQSIYENAHKREFKRVFGNGKFDYVINFEGYTVFWASLFGVTSINSIYQHNDLYGEFIMKYPYLKQTFNLYYLYNNIVSVSKKTKEHNEENLVRRFNLESKKFTYCDNIQNPKNILLKAQEGLEITDDYKIFKESVVFINIGRLSPEKGHKKLIKAFSKVEKIYPNIRLITLGDGLLKGEIDELIFSLKLQKKIFFLGHRDNPYAYIKASDCFILSSDHEGQPMTLFEAMILEKPIIATDIVGNRSVLDGRLGLMVDNSEDGLENGMLDFLEGRYIEKNIFDYNRYNRDALKMFYRKNLAQIKAVYTSE